ncbi:MAG TPA: M20/M25/M40 family metallo-hydrolase, partial [Ktedonobacterales bacterium]|nr:M20/M25/M40 family metallo-hydrolase [Ktedonobacterales bacterium]
MARSTAKAGKQSATAKQRPTPQAAPMESRLAETLIALAGIPSVSGQENAVRAWIAGKLEAHNLAPITDDAGNLIARVPAEPLTRDTEPPILLNAHMDRVPPGLAHQPILADGILRSDGTTNLGADDSAGIAVLLHTLEELRGSGLEHPPLLLLFTVGEEVGLTGAKAFDPTPWGAQEGIIFDNAGETGVVVTHAATYIAFDVLLRGSGGHPGKRLEGTTSAIEIFRRAAYPVGVLDGDTSRVSIGRIEGGSARNAVPRELRALGEARTLLEGEARARLLEEIALAFTSAATSLGGSAVVTFDPHCDGYTVDENEPLLRAWMAAQTALGITPRTITTFIGSDASALRAHARIFTVSTGAMDEHTSDEWIAVAPLATLVETTVRLLSTYHTGQTR